MVFYVKVFGITTAIAGFCQTKCSLPLNQKQVSNKIALCEEVGSKSDGRITYLKPAPFGGCDKNHTKELILNSPGYFSTPSD